MPYATIAMSQSSYDSSIEKGKEISCLNGRRKPLSILSGEIEVGEIAFRRGRVVTADSRLAKGWLACIVSTSFMAIIKPDNLIVARAG